MANETTQVAKIDGDMNLETAIAGQSELVRNAIAAGHIVAVVDEVTVSDNVSPTKKGARKDYLKFIAQNAQGFAALCNGKMAPATSKPADGKDERTDEQKAAGAADYFNYGYDLEQRASVRQQIMASLEGPEKQIKKAFDGMCLAGYSKTEAAEFITNSPKFKGVDGLPALLSRLTA